MFDEQNYSQTAAQRALISGLDQVAAQRPLTPIEAQLKFLESQNRQLIKMLSDNENLSKDKIIICAACFEKISKKEV